MTTERPVENPGPTAARIRSPGDDGLEAHGGALANILRGAGEVADLARTLLEAGGVTLTYRSDGPVVPDWFPLRLNLEVLDGIGRELGAEAVFEIGFSVPQHARFPPAISDLAGAMRALDVAFHMNHRRDGAVMYDAATGRMLDGIGNYGCQMGSDGRLIGRSTSVYPCAFDRGIFAGLAARFEPRSQVEHDAHVDCRIRGASACVYIVGR
jgi:hypothetical protein